MKNLKVTALILALTLSAGMLTACSSKEENNASVPTVESSESQVEESIVTETEESSEPAEDEDALTEAVLQHITVARVEEVAEDGTLKLTMFELPETAEDGAADEDVNIEETAATGASDNAQENAAETTEFDFATLGLSIFTETELTESYQTTGNEKIQLVKEGVLVEAALSDLQEGDMLVLFMDENEVPNMIIYRGILQEEAVVK